ncbi:hypothetical protein DYB25_004459 [Aphanomyces astaci]|uniref:Uncharacterized protein n=1 Tax=Aphanomyces astaci TaxID=112090 RepID=A0A397A562_APHAT|nr:hypothetical protein AaE_009227 [Aphanomyces astaci]RHY01494.1 hypothetical protein DYB25_004459 [Aphanomyces astaci]RHY08501.1 hypothetical protein DYB36_005340 [Aphanomyces astaci]RHY51987.1 hypothetical protein DYB34_005887 [Aphanomyces astaci]RHY52539.1 hypothetical protein DYB38_008162 [Aphanomyces astaci]
MSAIGALKKLDQQKKPDSTPGGILVRPHDIKCMIALTISMKLTINDFRVLSQGLLQSTVVKRARETFTWSTKQFWKWYQFGGRYTWIIATTLLFTVIPLGMEIMREGDVKEVEALRVQALKAQGYTAGQIAQMGYVDASTASLTEALQ